MTTAEAAPPPAGPSRPEGVPSRPPRGPRWLRRAPRWTSRWTSRAPRGSGLALGYAGLVLLVAVVLSLLPEALHQRAVLSASTNIENLRHTPAAVLLLSAFVVQSFGEVLLLAPLVVVMTVCSHRIGRASTLVAALFGHVGATLVVATFLAAGVRQGFVPRSVTTAPDVGVSYALAGTAGLLAACLPGRWRWVYVVGALAALALLIRADPDFTNAGHLVAFTTGLGLAVVAGQSQRRPPLPLAPPERTR